MATTSQLGGSNSKPGNLTLGGGTYVPVRQVTLTAGLTFSGGISSAKIGTLLYVGVVTVISQIRQLLLSQQRPVVIAQSRYLPLKVVQRTTSQLDSKPESVDMAITETYPYQVDVTQYMVSGDAISSISAVLTLLSTSAVVTGSWQGSISTAGNIIQVPINGPVLKLGQQYQLATTFTLSANKRLTVISTINVLA